MLTDKYSWGFMTVLVFILIVMSGVIAGAKNTTVGKSLEASKAWVPGLLTVLFVWSAVNTFQEYKKPKFDLTL